MRPDTSPARLARLLRRASATALAAMPASVIVAADAIARRTIIADYTPEALHEHEKAALLGVAMWTALVIASARDRGPLRWVARATLAALAFVVLGTQAFTFARYRTYLDWRVALMGSSLTPCFAASGRAERVTVAVAFLGPALLMLATAYACARVAPTRMWSARVALAFGLASVAYAIPFGLPKSDWDDGAPPDILYLSSVGALAKSYRSGADIMTTLANVPGSRTPRAVPVLSPRLPAARRNVVLLVNESVRASEACSAYERDPSACPWTAKTNAALPDRYGFREMRAVDSTTAISVAVMWSGLSPTASRADLHSAPLLWEYAAAAGYDTGYWSAQNLLFANAGRWLQGIPVSHWVVGTHLDPYATYQCGANDGEIMERALADIATMREPYVAVVQLSNTHFPYWIEDGEDPKDDELLRYRMSIRRQDGMIARFARELRARPESPRTVLVYLSDHGEAIRERGEIGHTWSVYDEEIRVPFFIDAPPGTLSDAESSNLRALERVRVTNLEVLPTLLDLMGVWDDGGVLPLRAAMPGVSLLRGPPPPQRAVVLSNCGALFSCATKNWGAMRGAMKLHATIDQGGFWKCFDTDADPGELHDLGVDACGDLRAIAEGDGRGMPK